VEKKCNDSGGNEGRFYVPIKNSTASRDVRDHPDRYLGTGSGAGEVELVVSMAEREISIADTNCLNASQPASSKRPKMKGLEERVWDQK
jgi:hypothetical protein